MNRILSRVIGVLHDRFGFLAPFTASTAWLVHRISATAMGIWKRREYLRVDTVAKNWWKRRMERKIEDQQQPNAETPLAPVCPDWEEVKDGGTKNGFRVWRLYDNEPMQDGDWRVTSRVIVEPPWPKYDADRSQFEKWMENEPLTVLGLVNRRRPNKSPDDSVLVLRRYSIVDPSVFADIVHIVYEGPDQENHRGWSFINQEQLDERTVAIRFVHLGAEADRIVLIDTHNRSYRQFEIPNGDQILPLRMFIGEYSRDHFSVLYADMNGNPSTFFNIDYEIEESQDPTFTTIRQLGMRSVAFGEQGGGFGHHNLFTRINLMQIPGVFFVFLSPGGNGFADLAFVFDHLGQCRKISELGVWFRSGLSKSVDRQIFHASDQFSKLMSLASENDEDWQSLSFNQFGDDLPSNLTIYYGDLLGTVYNEAMVQVHLRPPSMKRQSAEAIRRSVSKSDFPSVIKEETGVDIFDGIIEEKKKSVLMIRLDIDDNDGLIGLAGIVGLGL